MLRLRLATKPLFPVLLLLATVSSVFLASSLFFASLAWAGSEPALSSAVYKKIVEVQSQLQQKNSPAARDTLLALAQRKGNTDYDNAMIRHLLGYAYYQDGKLKQAAKTFQQVFDYPLPLPLMQNNRRLLGQVYLALGQYQDALTQLKNWLDSATADKEPVQVMVGQCYYELKQYRAAASQLQSAIGSYQAKGKPLQESWLSLLQASLAASDDIEGRIQTIKLLLAWYPKAEYWLALASAYAQLEQMDNYLAILALAQRKDLLTTDAQYVSLASVYFSQGAPQKASAILEEGLHNKIVKRSVRNLRFLSAAYTQARDYQQALIPLREAASMSDDGELDIMLGNALYQLARWDQAAGALQQGLDKELKVHAQEQQAGLHGEPAIPSKSRQNRISTGWLLLGQARLNLKQYEAAINAFQQAEQDAAHSKQAGQWLKYARYEQQRQAKLKQEAAESS